MHRVVQGRLATAAAKIAWAESVRARGGRWDLALTVPFYHARRSAFPEYMTEPAGRRVATVLERWTLCGQITHEIYLRHGKGERRCLIGGKLW